MIAGTTFYRYDDLPAYREPQCVPMKVTPTGPVQVYDFEGFFREAVEIDEATFEALKQRA